MPKKKIAVAKLIPSSYDLGVDGSGTPDWNISNATNLYSDIDGTRSATLAKHVNDRDNKRTFVLKGFTVKEGYELPEDADVSSVHVKIKLDCDFVDDGSTTSLTADGIALVPGSTMELESGRAYYDDPIVLDYNFGLTGKELFNLYKANPNSFGIAISPVKNTAPDQYSTYANIAIYGAEIDVEYLYEEDDTVKIDVSDTGTSVFVDIDTGSGFTINDGKLNGSFTGTIEKQYTGRTDKVSVNLMDVPIVEEKEARDLKLVEFDRKNGQLVCTKTSEELNSMFVVYGSTDICMIKYRDVYDYDKYMIARVANYPGTNVYFYCFEHQVEQSGSTNNLKINAITIEVTSSGVTETTNQFTISG